MFYTKYSPPYKRKTLMKNFGIFIGTFKYLFTLFLGLSYCYWPGGLRQGMMARLLSLNKKDFPSNYTIPNPGYSIVKNPVPAS